MANFPSLHPSVREHHEPRLSATALAEYLILQPDGQETILHDSRFSRPPIVTANGEALRALRAYNLDPYRNTSALDKAKSALRGKAASLIISPKARDEAMRCVEAIELFERNENTLGIRGLALSEPLKFEELTIEGVRVSIRPDFLVAGDNNRIGAAIIRVAKAPDPDGCKLEETRRRRGDHRREMARYMAAMLYMLMEEQGGGLGIPDRDLCFVADVRIGERIGTVSDHAMRVRAIRGACRQIQRLWASVTPRASILRK